MRHVDTLVVLRWKRDNVGNMGMGSLARLRSDGSFVVLTGPSPWGSGVWGPFPATTIVSARMPTDADAWPVSGCPSETWTLADLESSLVRSRH